MLRRKGRDASDQAELGRAIDYVPIMQMKKYTFGKLFKYLLLIVLGFIVHSAYKKIVEVNISAASNTGQPDTVKDPIHGKSSLGSPEVNRAVLRKNPKAEQEFRQKLKEDSRKIFDEHKNKNSKIEEKEQGELDESIFENENKNVEDVPEDSLENLVKEMKDSNEDHKKDEVDPNRQMFNEPGRDEEETGQNLKSIQDPLPRQVNEPIRQESNELKPAGDKSIMQDNDKKFLAKQASAEEIAETLKSLDEINAEEEKHERIENQIKHQIAEAALEAADVPVVPMGNVLPKSAEAEGKHKVKVFHQAAQSVAESIKKHWPQQIKEDRSYDHGMPAFVTAVSGKTFEEAQQLIHSFQNHLPREKLIVFDLDLNNLQRRKLTSLCGVRLRSFWIGVFPTFVRNINHFHWRPLVMQVALAEYGHIIWLNPTMRIINGNLRPLLENSERSGVRVVGTSAGYTTFAATHPQMYKFIPPTDTKKLSELPHIEIQMMVIHNTDEVQKNFMTLLTACAMDEACLAPHGSKRECEFDFTGKAHANCHQYDESAMNILLKNWFNYDTKAFLSGNMYFRQNTKDDFVTPKVCRSERDL